MSNFGNGYTVRSRKMRRCECCFGPIARGEQCHYYSGIYDGVWQSYHLHLECYEDLNKYNEAKWEFTSGGGDWPNRVKAYWKPFVGEALELMEGKVQP